MDFFKPKERSVKKGLIEVFPEFRVCHSKDLMTRGGAFYAIWDEEKGLWSTDEYDVTRIVDNELYAYKDKTQVADAIVVSSMSDFSSNSWIQFKKYLKSMADNFKSLDEKIIFSNTVVKKSDYVSHRLPYAMAEGDISAYEELMNTLYARDERTKIEWAIGSIISGESKDIQKFIVLYGEGGTGKSTVLNIIQKLFEGYYTTFDAKELASSSNTFATEVFRSNPMVAIQHDGDLSKIEDNTKLNSIVSHEYMTMNEKFKSAYTARTNCFLFLGTNKPVQITDAKSGIIRRLIDVRPTGNKVPPKRYFELVSQINFELGAIAKHCLDVYSSLGKNYYNSYKPIDMMFKTDAFYNFVEYEYDMFASEDSTTLARAYDMYVDYCDKSSVSYRLARHKFREELKNYFEKFYDRTGIYVDDDKGSGYKQVRSYYSGFLKEKFVANDLAAKPVVEPPNPWLILDKTESLFDKEFADCIAQYASTDEKEKPVFYWKDVTTTLKDISTDKLHYVKTPAKLITVDFDLKDADGQKSRDKNIEAASHWPPTYAEYSKGGSGIHLSYWYDGDPSKLAALYSMDIEIKVSLGGASLRRRLSLCNDIPIAHISGGLPIKEEKRVINFKATMNRNKLKELILRAMEKEFGSTKCSVDFIDKLLRDAYESGMQYDLTELRMKVLRFAMQSTHHSKECMDKVSSMKFKSEEMPEPEESKSKKLIFFDVEVFPNLFLVNWKFEGADSCVRMINPTSKEIEELIKNPLVGFNNRRYDNHIMYARYLGYSNEELYNLSQRIVSGQGGYFGEAYNLSYTDVYDFSSKKQSLKKFEIELGIHHQELGLPWDQPVPEEKWNLVAEYCDNDVFATEKVFEARKDDWTARQILADVAGMTVNDTTNSLTTKIIFQGEKHPQRDFNYRFMGDKDPDIPLTVVPGSSYPNYSILQNGKPIFPGYTFDAGHSIYRNEEAGEGGYVYAEPGMYTNVALLDIASMHPSSIVAEQLFGPYTKRFEDILQARIAIKHKEFDRAKSMLDGKLTKYLDNPDQAKGLAGALKIAINSVYGLTSATFDNPFRDTRNVDNIVAKRGALFMINLKHEVQARGYTVAHIKTDSIKIPDATPEIIQFVMDYGKAYGYNFEHEATYERLCLVNKAVYICKDKATGEWSATGDQFQVPYVFKTLFSKEPVLFEDLCETKSVSSAIYLDFPDNEEPSFVGKVGCFCPMVEGCGAGKLLRDAGGGKFNAVEGTKGYLWMEAEMVKKLGLESKIDLGYYNTLVNKARDTIAQYGDFEMFRD